MGVSGVVLVSVGGSGVVSVVSGGVVSGSGSGSTGVGSGSTGSGSVTWHCSSTSSNSRSKLWARASRTSASTSSGRESRFCCTTVVLGSSPPAMSAQATPSGELNRPSIESS